MHLIHKHSITVNCTNEQIGHQIKDEISSIIQDALYPRLETLLEKYNKAGHVWRIENIPVTLNAIKAKSWKVDIVDQSIDQIAYFLEEHKPGRIDALSEKDHILQLLLIYLKTGTLEANNFGDKLDIIFSAAVMDVLFIEKVKASLQGEFQAILRWSLNVPSAIKLKFLALEQIMHDLNFTKNATEQSQQLNDFMEYLYWIGIFNKDLPVLIGSEISQLRSMAQRYFNIEENHFNRLLFVQSNGDYQHFEEKPSIHDQSIYFINNAGLLLFHPFLQPLFKKLNLLEGDDWKDSTSQHRAVLITQYLTGFDSNIFESDLLLPKILCGVPVQDTVRTQWEISKKEIELSEELLKAVIEHWKVLKTITVKTLQETFIQRAAKAIQNKKGAYEITVEQKSFDLLLDQLPWVISTIKTPWMEHFLSCYWN